jgi:hypothetical protein
MLFMLEPQQPFSSLPSNRAINNLLNSVYEPEKILSEGRFRSWHKSNERTLFFAFKLSAVCGENFFDFELQVGIRFSGSFHDGEERDCFTR